MVTVDTLPTVEEIVKSSQSFFNTPMFVLTIALVLLGIVSFVCMTYLITQNKRPVEVLRAFGIPLIVVSGSLLIVTGFGSDQISPIIGLLGTIAGYLLGRTQEEFLSARKENKGVSP